MADRTMIEREQAAIRAHYARRDFSRMSAADVYEAFVGRHAHVHHLTADPAEFVRRSPYCTDLTAEQRGDVIEKLREFVRGMSTGMPRRGIRARIGICTDVLRREVPLLVEMGESRRIPHETMLCEVRRLQSILQRLEANLRDDAVMPTDPAGVEWVDVSTRYEADRESYEIDARVYLDGSEADDDGDIVDVQVVSLNDEDEPERTVDPDDVFHASHRHLWRDAVRRAAQEKACELGLCCARCGEYLGDECSCADQREVAHA